MGLHSAVWDRYGFTGLGGFIKLEHTEYQRRRMKDVADISIAIPQSHAQTPARLLTPRSGQLKVSSTHLLPTKSQSQL